MDEKRSAISDQILDLLLDALQERQRQREGARPPAEAPPAPVPVSSATVDELQPGLEEETLPELPEAPPEEAWPEEDYGQETEEIIAEETVEEVVIPPPPGEETPSPAVVPGVNLDLMLGRLALVILILIILVNIPFDRFGTSLARAMPDSAALVIRDGLLLKGSDEKVYVLQDDKRRWISTLDAFEEYGYQWSQVHVVEDDFLAQFKEGLPIHLLLKCQTSPHIYALEGGRKRWIKDIPTFEAQLYQWEDVRFVSCSYLRNLPDGLPIPEDAGSPPQP